MNFLKDLFVENEGVVDLISKSNKKFEVYKDKKEKWRWRFLVDNNIVATSSDGYSSKFKCEQSIVYLNTTKNIKVVVSE